MDDTYDTPWKEVVMDHFPEFMAFYFPKAHAAIDWSQPHVFLDQELAALSRDAELGKRVLDKLVRVHTYEMGEQWVLIHLEVQGQHDSEFARRMFIYNYRVYDRYSRPVASMALLADESRGWRPSGFGWRLLDCSMQLDFPVAKMQDYADDIDALLAQDNPFALVTVAHLLAQRTRGNAHQRRMVKWRLTKLLYQRNWDKQRIINLYRVIDWIMRLPAGLEKRLRTGILHLERRPGMTYLSSIERIGMEIGRQKGLQEGRQEGREEGLRLGLAMQLSIRFGRFDPHYQELIDQAGSEQLTQWAKNFVHADHIEAVFHSD
ncbi:MAG: Yae1 family protein [Duganella sp.]